MLGGDRDGALEFIQLGVDAGLHDYLWIQRCPLLDPLRELPAFRGMTAILASRAAAVLAMLP